MFKKVKIQKTGSTLYKRGKSEIPVYMVVFVLFVMYSLLLLVPLGMIFFSSFKDPLEYNHQLFNGTIYKLPTKFVFSNYAKAFTMMKVPVGTTEVGLLEMTWNTLWICFASSFVNVFTHLTVAYACARYKFFANKILCVIALVFMILPVYGTTGASLKLTIWLGIYDTPWVIILTAFEGFGFLFFMLISFYEGISWEYAEAVFIDGGNHWTVFFHIMLPQSLGIAFVLFMNNFLAQYGDYASRLLFTPSYITIATGLYYESMLLTRTGKTPIYFSALFLASIPTLLIYICFNKRMMTSMNIGGIKG